MSDSFDVRTQLADLALLEEGWQDGNQGKQLSQQGIEWLADSWERFCPPDLSTPYLYSTLEGNVCAEWSFEEFGVTLEVNLSTYIGNCFVMDMSTHTKIPCEVSYDFNEEQVWKQMFKSIRRCQKLSLL